jgi:3-hydroxyisobutyrate dehydrogenase-like beta-hydroxyacid dehydrogenase
MSKPRVGFIGIGIMGAPMAGHLAKAGYPLTAHDINRTKADALVAEYKDVVVADTPRAVADNSEITDNPSERPPIIPSMGA